MDSLPPIPAPRGHFLREFRIQFLPLVVFVAVVVAIFYLWRTYVQPLHIVGEVEAIRSNLISIQDGTLVELRVDRFDQVAKDQPLGRITTIDPATHEASLRVIEKDLKLMQARMGLDKVRNLDSYSRFRIELLTEKIALGIAQARVKQAESELQRTKQLVELKIIPYGVAQGPNQNNIFGVEVAQRDLEALQVEIVQRTKLIAELEQQIKAVEQAGAAQIAPTDPAIDEAIRAQQEQLALTQKDVVLKAPYDGIVSLICKRPGEKLTRGEPILVLCPSGSGRIVGYIRQPLTAIPTTNDTVQVKSRSQHRQIATARILKVGTQLELINPSLISLDSTRAEFGLPILVAVPENMHLMPGEFVDLALQISAK